VVGVDLDLTQVRAFAAAAGQLHFGRAAAQLFLTQQALSKRISRLEQALGEQLFVRGTRGVELSDAGRRFLPHARRLLAAADAAAFAARSAGRRGTGTAAEAAGDLPVVLPGRFRFADPGWSQRPRRHTTISPFRQRGIKRRAGRSQRWEFLTARSR